MDDKNEKEEDMKEAAEKQGYTLMKSKKGYMIVNYYTSRIEAGQGYSYSLEDVERYLQRITAL